MKLNVNGQFIETEEISEIIEMLSQNENSISVHIDGKDLMQFVKLAEIVTRTIDQREKEGMTIKFSIVFPENFDKNSEVGRQAEIFVRDTLCAQNGNYEIVGLQGIDIEDNAGFVDETHTNISDYQSAIEEGSMNKPFAKTSVEVNKDAIIYSPQDPDWKSFLSVNERAHMDASDVICMAITDEAVSSGSLVEIEYMIEILKKNPSKRMVIYISDISDEKTEENDDLYRSKILREKMLVRLKNLNMDNIVIIDSESTNPLKDMAREVYTILVNNPSNSNVSLFGTCAKSLWRYEFLADFLLEEQKADLEYSPNEERKRVKCVDTILRYVTSALSGQPRTFEMFIPYMREIIEKIGMSTCRVMETPYVEKGIGTSGKQFFDVVKANNPNFGLLISSLSEEERNILFKNVALITFAFEDFCKNNGIERTLSILGLPKEKLEILIRHPEKIGEIAEFQVKHKRIMEAHKNARDDNDNLEMEAEVQLGVEAEAEAEAKAELELEVDLF